MELLGREGGTYHYPARFQQVDVLGRLLQDPRLVGRNPFFTWIHHYDLKAGPASSAPGIPFGIVAMERSRSNQDIPP